MNAARSPRYASPVGAHTAKGGLYSKSVLVGRYFRVVQSTESGTFGASPFSRVPDISSLITKQATQFD